MNRPLFSLLAASLLASGCMTSSTASQSDASAITAALADSSRPEAERARDTARKTSEVLAFAGIGRGDKVGDFIMGGGYLTRVLASLVGPDGRVYALQPQEFVGFRKQYGDDQDAVAAAYRNVTPLRPSLGAVSFPEPLDAIVTVQNWHDMHLSIAPPTLGESVARSLYTALKPGGTLVVIDHEAAAGSGFRDSDKLHRAEGAAVRAEIEKAGFRFDGEGDFLRLASDAKTVNVFDPAIRGKTDQFVYRFRKPS